jgi:DnaJ-class molecular chaperone
MVFVIEEKPHATFRRDGNDLVMTAVGLVLGAWLVRGLRG